MGEAIILQNTSSYYGGEGILIHQKVLLSELLSISRNEFLVVSAEEAIKILVHTTGLSEPTLIHQTFSSPSLYVSIEINKSGRGNICIAKLELLHRI